MVDTKNETKRTFYLPEWMYTEVKVRAARDHVFSSDVVQKALEQYLGLVSKSKEKK